MMPKAEWAIDSELMIIIGKDLSHYSVEVQLDCSKSSIFSWDRLDVPRLTVTAILILKRIKGAGVASSQTAPAP